MNIAHFFYKYQHENVFVGFFSKLYRKFFLRSNSSRIAFLRKCGTKIGKNCTVSSVGIFGTEPYLIEVGDNVYFSGSDIKMLTHDGGRPICFIWALLIKSTIILEK